jgi:NADH-quinone oxidoreductase subunit M
MVTLLSAYYELEDIIKFIFSTPDFIFIIPLLGMIISPFLYLFFKKDEVKYFFLTFSVVSLFQNSYQAYKLIILNDSTINFVKFKYIESSYSIGNNIDFYVVIDNISALHIVITAFVISVCFVNITFNTPKRIDALTFLLFTIQILLYVGFSCPNFFIFYTCFEASLIPFFLIVGIWGGREEFRIASAFRLIFYTLVCSTPLFISLIYVFSSDKSFDFTHLKFFTSQTIFFQNIFIISALFSFFVKVPVIPFHSWLPDAHSEAPTLGSMLLAGVMLKLGTYGLYRLMWPFFKLESSLIDIKTFIISIAVFTICMSCYLLSREIDMKRIVALYSINHMGFVVLGLCMNQYGVTGSIVINASHCLSSVGLFFLVGQLYSRLHSRKLSDIKGLAFSVPFFSFFLVLLFLANMSFPSTLNFTGEFSVIASVSTLFVFTEATTGVSGISEFLTFFYNNFWYMTFAFSLIWAGIISVRFITVLLFSSPDLVRTSTLRANLSSNDTVLLEDAKSYEIFILFVLTFTLIASALMFSDISIFFDPKLSYSTRLISLF